MAKSPEAPATETAGAHDPVSAAEVLAAQPTVRIKLMQRQAPEPKLPDEVVIFNGCRYVVPRGVAVDVPETVAEILEQAGRI